ncbi:Cilia- and flagella-associated protein 44 (WD repeat-containing protein 52) [Durusdinium trenchii]|uniref:Cilia- and flagella-associated protein 44 (WD repeat-containing protein 52) n=1 Tax=Durusdinium trenchii TaxID=1381693 RepID=A0ABP0I8C7_9DINO
MGDEGGGEPSLEVTVRLREPCEAPGEEAVAVHHGFGLGSRKRNNAHILGEDCILTTVGSAAALVDTASGSIEYIFSPDDQGIGAVCVHPSKRFFAMGGQGDKPNVYIYTYPSLRLHRVLRLGTERSYACMAFNSDGTKLATVGGSPDFLLTVWDWDESRIILRNKAFAQEVYNVSFAPNKDGFLTTSGLGHIRFWKMAETFTGLKLQGDIGKFGKVELSDVAAYAVMPDGKVLSGSESGSLLLWDGNFIKLEVRRPGNQLPHDGEVHVCHLLGGNGGSLASTQFLTAGEDGWLRWWSAEAIDSAETTDENPSFELKPAREVHLEGMVPISIAVGDGYMVVQDRNGGIYRIDDPILPACDPVPVVTGHSGPITAVVTSPVDHFAVTSGMDKTVRLWNYVARKEIFKHHFSSPATCAVWAPPAVDATGRTVLVGFQDGVVRVLRRCEHDFKLCKAFKPHNAAVRHMRFNPSGDRLATVGLDQTVFLFNVGSAAGSESFSPIGFVGCEQDINALAWSSAGDYLLLGCSTGLVKQITLPHPSNSVSSPSTQRSFELQGLPERNFSFRRKVARPKRQEPEAPADGEDDKQRKLAGDDEEEDSWEVECKRLEALPVGNVLSLFLLDESDVENPKFVIGLDGADAGPLFVCSFGSEHPVQTLPNIPCDDGMNQSEEVDPAIIDPKRRALRHFVPGTGVFNSCTTLEPTWSQNFLINGGSDGSVRIRPLKEPQCFVHTRLHDGRNGEITRACTSFDDTFLLSAGTDGVLFVSRVNPNGVQQTCATTSSKPGNRIKAKKARIALAENPEAAKEAAAPDAIRPIPEVVSHEKAIGLGFPPTEDPQTADAHDPAAEAAMEEAIDIVDPSAYSIQDDKLKTAEDTKQRLADVEKDKMRSVIDTLRRDFEALLKENEQDVPETRLERDAFNIDEELMQSLEAEGKHQLEEVSKETQWDVAQSKAKVEKIKSFYLDDLIMDAMEMAAFNGKYAVNSFRTLQFSKALKQALATVCDLLSSAEGQHATSSTGAAAEEASGVTQHGSGQHGDKVGAGASAQSKDGKGSGEGSGWEARKAGRRVRKAQMQLLMESKPDDNADDPADVAAIDWVMKNMGDYKLKSAENYQVPIALQVNAEKKIRQSVLLAESIQTLRMEFNQKFLALRELKRRIIENARKDQARIFEINAELGEPNNEHVGLPLSIDPAEWPEKRLEYTEEQLEAFIRGSVTPNSGEAQTTLNGDDTETKNESSAPERPVRQVPMFDFAERVVRRIRADARTRFEQEVWNEKQKQLLYEKNSILERSLSAVQAFDSAVYDLRKERAQLHADLTAAELRQILLSRELRLLNEFEKKDVALSQKLELCKQQRTEVVTEISGCLEKLAAKKAEVEVWQEKDRLIMDEFNAIVGGDSNPAYAALLKIFKRKIKRAKQTGEEGSDSDDSDEEDDEDYDDEEEDDEDGEPEEERCPDGCDPAIYEKVLELREKRLDQEEVLNEYNKAIDELRKANDRHQGREKQIDKELKGTVLEIQAFQNEKQRKLNEIDLSIVLKLSQLACLVGPDGEPDQPDSAEDDASALDENEFMQEEFEADDDIDTHDPAIKDLKDELERMYLQMEVIEETADEDNMIEQQQVVLDKVRNIKMSIWRLRNQARRVRERKSRLVLPETIDSSLVFDKGELEDLHEGIGTLIAENKKKKAEYKDLHLTQKRLVKEKRQKEGDIAALQSKCDDLQMLKFGQLIDLDAIEKITGEGTSNDLKSKYAEQELAQRKEQAAKQKEITRAQESLLLVTRDNSKLLQRIASLTEKQQELEVELGSLSGAGGGAAMESHRETQETEKLTQLVHLQSREIDALKAEINLLRGGNPRTNQNQILD